MITTHRARPADHPYIQPLASDSAWISLDTYVVRDSNKYKGECLMENNTQDELKAHLMATSEEFRSWPPQHAQLHKQLEELEAKHHLTDQEQWTRFA